MSSSPLERVEGATEFLKSTIKKEIQDFVMKQMFPSEAWDMAVTGVFKIDRKNLIGDILEEIAKEMRGLTACRSDEDE